MLHAITNQSSPLTISSRIPRRRQFGTRNPRHALFDSIIIVFPVVKFLHQIDICLLVVSSNEGVNSWCAPDSTPAAFIDKQNKKALSHKPSIIIKIHSSDLLDKLDWKRLEIKTLKQPAVIMYKIHNKLSSSYLRRIFANITSGYTAFATESYNCSRFETKHPRGAKTTIFTHS